MNKLLSALFQEVHDMESHGKMIDGLMTQVKANTATLQKEVQKS